MPILSHRLNSYAAAGLLAASLSAGMCASAAAQTLTIGVRAGPESIDPHFTATGTQAEALKHVFDTLVWSGDSAGGFVSESYRDEARRSQVLRVRMNTDEVVIDPNAAVRITTNYSAS
jgi:ABC-type transport system substrate-binding protein